MFNKPASTDTSTDTVLPVVSVTPKAEQSQVPTSQPTQQSSKKLLIIVSVVVLLLAAAFGAFALMQQPANNPPEPQPTITPTATPEPTEEAAFCTMDAKICPDGSSVGRVPPSCEFEACPGEEATESSNKNRFTDDILGFSLVLPSEWPKLEHYTWGDTASFYLPLRNISSDDDRDDVFMIGLVETAAISQHPQYDRAKKILDTENGTTYIFWTASESATSKAGKDEESYNDLPQEEELYSAVVNGFQLIE